MNQRPEVDWMKRIAIGLIAVAAAAIATVGIVRATGDPEPQPRPSASRDRTDDVSRDVSMQQLKAQAKEQAKQMLIAQAHLEATRLKKGHEHELRVTIREVEPYDAYKPGSRAGECVRVSVAPANLMVSDGSGKYPKDLAHPVIPATARLTSTGACEATIAVHVPYATLYDVGVAIEGRGIALPTDPGDTHVKAVGSAQSVVVLR